jgi:hypothetical protein
VSGRTGISNHSRADGRLRLLAESPEVYAGVLRTIDLESDPVEVYESLAAFRPPSLDLLLPHANWSSTPPGTGEERLAGSPAPYADWLIAVFDRWFGAPERRTGIRLFTEIMALLLGLPSATEAVGNSPVAATAGNVGLLMWEYGERDEALWIGERTLLGMRQAVGDDHPWALGAALDAAGARSLAGDGESAVELSRETLGRAKQVMGESHPLSLSCKAALSDDLRSMRRGQEAAELEQEALQQLSDTLGLQHPHTMSVRRRERPYWDFEPQPT